MPTVEQSAGASRERGPLLERSDHVSTLEALFASVVERARGSMVFVGGEAGVGKTALVQRFRGTRARSVRVFSGACDALVTPRPLGPFLDLAPALGGEFEALAEHGARPYEIAAALLRALAAGPPALLIIEDAHWADEGTLDVVRFLGRRVETVPALVLVTYRDDLDRTHPLRIVLGEVLPGEAIHRLQLAPLSPQAVAELAAPHGLDAAELFRKTAGNPFFITEALAAGDVTIPPTVRDAVLARVARVPAAAIELLEAVAIVPPQIELWLLERLAGGVLDHLDACLDAGILAHAEGAVAFRHELARLTIDDLLMPTRRTLLHRRALEALAAPPTGAPDVARLAHHAEAAGDAHAVQRYAPAAAARAAVLGSHYVAVAQYARALRAASGLPPADLGELNLHYAHECFLADHLPATNAAGRDAVEYFHSAGDRLREGDALRQLSYHLRCTGHATEAREVGLRAVALLEQLPHGHELALAYGNAASLSMNGDDAEGTFAFGQRAYALAQRLEDVEAQVHALNTVGTMELLCGVTEGAAKLQSSIALAQAAGLEEQVGRGYINLGWGANRSRSYTGFDRALKAGLDYCSEHGLLYWQHYLLAYGARGALDQGRWPEASDLAQQILRDPRSTLPRIPALVALALMRARRGDPECWPPLNEALAAAEPTGELQHIAPVAAARAEVAWLEGRPAEVAAATETASALDLALRHRASWVIGELACWRRRAGLDYVSEGAAEPFARELAGDWEGAAALWTQRGCPYEAALARASADDETALRESLATMQRLGARVAAGIVARRLRELGAHNLPRGPRPGTRANAAHLTARELEVLALLAQGLRNADIADRLFLSAKTVDHHISAVLAKLDAHTRSDAVRTAGHLGLLHPAQVR